MTLPWLGYLVAYFNLRAINPHEYQIGPYRIVNPNAERRLLEEGFSFLRNSQMEMAEERFKKYLLITIGSQMH